MRTQFDTPDASATARASAAVRVNTLTQSSDRQAGNQVMADHAQSELQTFFDELKNGTRHYRTVASLDAQIAQEYRGRCILELLQNAHDALANLEPDDPQRISFVLSTDPEPVLLVGNTGHPFRREDFKGICQLAQSPKDPNKSVGNKGLGFRSVLEVSGCPEIWSTSSHEGGERFVFRFDPAVIDRVAEAAQNLERRGLGARSPFNPDCSLVDWSQKQLDKYCQFMVEREIDAVHEARKFLSPYQFPLPVEVMPPGVRRLLDTGHATVIRLRLDGGKMLASEEAVQSVKKQLDDLRDTRSVVFLEHLAELVIEADEEQHVLNRALEAEVCLSSHPRTRQRRLRIETAPADAAVRQFRGWTRVVGGDDDVDGAESIRTAVEHLPNRWPKVRQATVGIAVEDTPASAEGVFVIFLPTEKTTGTGTHINAPFYGSLDRRQIDFNERYNEFILEGVLDLCLDAVGDLVAGQAEVWRARAVLDILSSVTAVRGEQWSLVSKLCERAEARGWPLHEQALILCDDGWRTPGEARVMADISDDDSIGVDRWREHAGFALVSKELDGRKDAVRRLLENLEGKPSPTHREWVDTIERAAKWVRDCQPDINWNDFLRSLLAILPSDLRAEPKPTDVDPLTEAHFLPTADGRLIAASDSAKLFFQPVRGVDDLAELVEEVPTALEGRIAFLHPDVRTHEGQPRRNTEIQKFLDGRFARGPRREDLLQSVVIPALPSLPAAHGNQEAADCAEILAWTLRLLGDEPPDTLLPLLPTLPVCCDDGWFPMSAAVFGPGWQERHGDDVAVLVDELPDEAAQRLRRTMLLPPNDERWGAVVEDWGHLFERAGVFDGLRLQEVAVTFGMDVHNNELLKKLPANTPPEAWADWYNNAVDLQPYYGTWYQYKLSGVQLLPEIHHLATLKQSGRRAFSRLVLASLGRWDAGWESAIVKKTRGWSWQQEVASPLKHWLRMTAWLSESGDVAPPLSRRWLVPESLLRGQAERYAHLDPLSLGLARELNADPALQDQLSRLGLNVYPTEDDQTGPELLEALARAWTANTVPIARFNVFLGQVRDAWRHFNPNEEFPDTFLVRTGRQRSFSTRGRGELTDVYLPDDVERTRTLREHGKDILELRTGEARRIADALIENVDIKRASQLEERHTIDGTRWEGQTDGVLPLDQTKYEWLPIVLLSIAAYGGTNPAGATTKTWRNAADRLRCTHVLECEEIDVELVDGDLVVGSSKPPAQWLHGDVLAIRRDLESYEDLAAAAQAMLDRQDLLKDLRLVLGKLPTQEAVTPKLIEIALERSEIDSQALADIRQRWAGDLSLIVDRVRPVLKLFEIPEHGLDLAATHIDSLSEWLSVNFTQWDTQSLLSAARKSRDDHAMGTATWQALGDDAQLPAWNAALAKLGDGYETVENRSVSEQTKVHLEEAKPLLRALARHVAVEVGDPSLFRRIEEVSRDFVGNADWSKRWWEVPFGAVLGALRDRYAEIPCCTPHLKVIEGLSSVGNLRNQFDNWGIEIAPNPYETADRNRSRLAQVLDSTRDLHQAWTEACGLNEGGPELPGPLDEFDTTAYLEDWPDDRLLAMALQILNDKEFTDACDGCSTLDAIRQKLDLTPEAVEARRQERHRLQREVERQHRIFDVAGEPFEVGSTSYYRDLFDHLDSLSVPEGPHASKDELTVLAKVKKRRSSPGGIEGRMPSHHPSAAFTDLVGVVGEIWAYRILRKDFGEEAVTREAWVSTIRLKVQPPVKSEPHDARDDHGFDFRFTHRRTKWHVEVKATAGNDSQFELGISEIRAANRLAQGRGGRWRILRVLNALSDRPEFEWLPNPFEDDSKERFRLHSGGMRVSYSRQ